MSDNLIIIVPILALLLLLFLLSHYKKIRRANLRQWFASWIFLAGMFLYINIEFRKDKIYIPVIETDFHGVFVYKDSIRHPSIKNYQNAAIKSSPEIEIVKPGVLVRTLAPSNFFLQDPFYCILILITSIISLVKMWGFDYKSPFTHNLSKTFRWIAIIFLSFWILTLLRIWWFNSVVRNLTDNQYYHRDILPIYQLELWMGVFLYRLSQIIKAGETLQKEQDLTI